MCAIMDSLMNETTIKTTIEICQDLGAKKDDTVKKVMEKFNLTKKATAKVKEIWTN